MNRRKRFRTAVLALSLVATMSALHTAHSQPAESAPDFASTCPTVAALQDSGRIDTIARPFGDLDIDNNGSTERVTEVVQGSAGVHAIAVSRDGAEPISTTCEGCADNFTNAVRVIAIEERNYVIEYSSGFLARLWEMSSGSSVARCWFQPRHEPEIEISLDAPLCEAVLRGRVGHVAMELLPRKQQTALPAMPELGIYPFNSKRASKAFRADLDNDGIDEDVIQLSMSGVSCRMKHAVMILDADGLPEISPRNEALSAAQASSCHDPHYGVIEFDGRVYLEGAVRRDDPPPDSAPARPFWSVLELTSDGARELCRFRFQSSTTSYVAGE